MCLGPDLNIKGRYADIQKLGSDIQFGQEITYRSSSTYQSSGMALGDLNDKANKLGQDNRLVKNSNDELISQKKSKSELPRQMPVESEESDYEIPEQAVGVVQKPVDMLVAAVSEV